MGYRADTIALSIAEAIHISPCAIHISERRLQERTGVGNIALTIAEAMKYHPAPFTLLNVDSKRDPTWVMEWAT